MFLHEQSFINNRANSYRLDAQKKQMILEKEKLLSENKKAEGGLDALVGELDGLSKVCFVFSYWYCQLNPLF